MHYACGYSWCFAWMHEAQSGYLCSCKLRRRQVLHQHMFLLHRQQRYTLEDWCNHLQNPEHNPLNTWHVPAVDEELILRKTADFWAHQSGVSNNCERHVHPL